MKNLHQMILDAEQKSAHWLMVANDLREKGRDCPGCGRGFIPRKAGATHCPSCSKFDVPQVQLDSNLCRCGHPRSRHFNGQGMCDHTGCNGGACLCRRFKKASL